MKVGLSLPIKLSSEKKLEFTLIAQELGVSSIWVGDNPPINNAFLDIGRLIGSTSKISFWTGITSPFYYSIEVLFSLSVWLTHNYPGRFGLGLGIGDTSIIKDREVIRKPKQKLADFPPLAIGGGGNRMIDLAFTNAEFLLLNSGSILDLKRAIERRDLVNKEEKDQCHIIPYSMLQITENDRDISLTLWNIIKDIAKGTSEVILKKH
ncbi:MAG: LLM class flavin-dependent oxidoreductase [Candidatus Heimdallarchaeaceae archaeon]